MNGLAASADYQWHPDWSAGAGIAEVRNRYSGRSDPFSNYDATVADIRLAYAPATGNRVEMRARNTDGRYPTQGAELPGTPGSGFRQDDVELGADWAFAGHSRLTGRIGMTARRYSGIALASRDFSGPTGRVAYAWAATGKLNFDFLLRREIGAQEDLNANYVVTSAASLTPTWAFSEKIKAHATAEIRKRDFRGDPGIATIIIPGGVDFTQYYSAGAEWAPTRSLRATITLAHEVRTGDNPGHPNYRADTAAVNVQLRF